MIINKPMRRNLFIVILILFSFHVFANDSIPVFDYYFIRKINIKGNKRTKKQIILRELTFQENDSICYKGLSEEIKNTRENLLNTLLFNFVTINYNSISQTNNIEINIEVIERWYIWPFPIFKFSERNFNTWWKNKNFSRINYGSFITDNNFRGRKELMQIKMNFGYDREFSLLYQVPYLDKNQNIGLGFTTGVIYNHETNYNTFNNKLIYFKDNDNYVKENYFTQFILTYRNKIHDTHFLYLCFDHFNFSDTLLKLNNNFSVNNSNHLKYFSIKYWYKNDYRDFRSYPLTGYYFDLIIMKNGFNIFGNNNPDMFYIESTYKKYLKIKKQLYFASAIIAKKSFDKKPAYYLQTALGYGHNYARSYEYYVIDGKSFVLFKSNFKYALIPTRIKEIDFLPSEKFSKLYYALYFNIFADAAYVEANKFSVNNSLADEFLFGTGIGFDFVTYYDMVFRIEYSFNRKGDNGVFLHFMAPL